MEVKIENKQIQKIKIQKVYILRHQKKKKIPHMNNIEKGQINKKKIYQMNYKYVTIKVVALIQ